MKNKIRFAALIYMFLLLFVTEAYSQNTGIHTNALYWLTTTPNAGMDFRAGSKSTVGFTIGYNPFRFPSYTKDGTVHNPKFANWFFVPEYRYWLRRPYERWFIGGYALYGEYNIEGFPFMHSEKFRYKGIAAGGGISAGFQWALGERWGVELSAGLGYTYIRYDKFDCGACGELKETDKRHWIGPNKLSLTFIYYIQ